MLNRHLIICVVIKGYKVIAATIDGDGKATYDETTMFIRGRLLELYSMFIGLVFVVIGSGLFIVEVNLVDSKFPAGSPDRLTCVLWKEIYTCIQGKTSELVPNPEHWPSGVPFVRNSIVYKGVRMALLPTSKEQNI